jgi:hypothetical protein
MIRSRGRKSTYAAGALIVLACWQRPNEAPPRGAQDPQDWPPVVFPSVPVCPTVQAADVPMLDMPIATSTAAATNSAVSVAWRRRPAPGARLNFDGALDAEGNVYWSECWDREDCDVVSVDVAGTLRWRTRARRTADAPLLVAGGVILVGTVGSYCPTDPYVRTWTQLSALRTSDGGIAWTSDIRELALSEWPSTAKCPRSRISTPTIAGATAWMSVALTDASNGTDGEISGLIEVDTRTGALAYSRRFFEDSMYTGVSTPLSGADGALYVMSYPCVFAQTALAIAPTHAELFSSSEALPGSGWSHLVAVGRTSLFESRLGADGHGRESSQLRWRSRSDGSLEGSLTGFEVLDVAEADGIAYAVGFLNDIVPRVPVVARLDLGRSTVEWVRTLPHAPDEWVFAESHVVTRSGSLLIVTRTIRCVGRDCGPTPSALLELGADGTELFRAALPGDAALAQDESAASDGLFFVAVEDVSSGAVDVVALELPHLAPADHGWVTRHGSMSRGNTPR